MRLRRALIASYDPSQFLPLARALQAREVELWATSGTARSFTASGLSVHSTEELTGIGSWFGGRVKTLHPAIFGGILAPRTEDGQQEMESHHLVPFDLVAVHLYPFEEALAQGGSSLPELVELIDVGGPSLLRAAAKNFRWVTAISGPEEARIVLDEIERTGGSVGRSTRRRLAGAVFRRTMLYDAAIVAGLSGVREEDGSSTPAGTAPKAVAETSRPPCEVLTLTIQPDERLRYGENPHQPAWVYRFAQPPAGISPWPLSVVKGDRLSYNNYLDIESSLALVSEFGEPAAAVIKHATPCGVAIADDVEHAVARALATDPVARYGCVIATNRPVSEGCVAELKGTFVDLLVAPGYGPGAIERLSKRPKVKVARYDGEVRDIALRSRREARTATGRLLLEEADQRVLAPAELRQVSQRAATPEELAGLHFAWKVVRYVRSNAIVLAQPRETVGIGGGQTSRVGAVQAALDVAQGRARGAVMASDAYFPFPDGVEAAAKAGVTAVLHPGGSLRDAEVIDTANRYGMTMYTTGWRTFRH